MAEYSIYLSDGLRESLKKEEKKDLENFIKKQIFEIRDSTKINFNKTEYTLSHSSANLHCRFENGMIFVSKIIKGSNVPPFFKYYARTYEMNSVQKKFYKHMKESLKSGKFISVDGNMSYLFCYVWEEVLPLLDKNPLESYSKLLELFEMYSGKEQKFADYCINYSLESLLYGGEYKKYLELTEPSINGKIKWGNRNLRVNLLEDLNFPISALDYVSCFGIPIPKLAKKHPGIFVESLEEIKEYDEKSVGDWMERIKKYPDMKKTWEWSVFEGSLWEKTLPFKIALYYAAYDFCDILREKIREAENNMRDRLNIPRIGEGWVNETSLYNLIKNEFPNTPVIHHGRPEWLGKQHLDIWLPRWRIAVEYHGKQHFEPVKFFGGEEAYRETVKRDERKAKLCLENKVELIIATENDEFSDIVAKIKNLIENK